jgi:hypothetical protein
MSGFSSHAPRKRRVIVDKLNKETTAGLADPKLKVNSPTSAA